MECLVDGRAGRHIRRAICAEHPLQDHFNPLDIPEEAVRARYRLSPRTILFITDIIKPYLERLTGRSMNRAMPPVLQVCATLGFLATGSLFNGC